jgi:hypothetical protein
VTEEDVTGRGARLTVPSNLDLLSMGLTQAEFFAGLATQLKLQAAGIAALYGGNADADLHRHLGAHLDAAEAIERQIADWSTWWRQHDSAGLGHSPAGLKH